MSIFSIHADFDQNGVLNSSPSEYSLRNFIPGALITPNLDADGVILPSSVSCGSPPRLDLLNATKPANDNDLIPIVVKAFPGTIFANFDVKLKISDEDSPKVKLYNSSRRQIRGVVATGFTNYSLNFTNNNINLFLEAVTITGSPSLNTQSSNLSYLIPTSTVGTLSLHLEVTEIASGRVIENDRCVVTPSPLILLGDDANAEKLYMCQINGSTPSLSDNLPSYSDITRVMRRIRNVQFVSVPVNVSNGDSWVQDQFQVGYCQSANSAMKVVFHLPRLRSDASLAVVANGLSCIATDHFPSSNLGVFNDFWTRSISIRDVTNGIQRIPFVNTVELQMIFNKTFNLNSYLINIIYQVKRSVYGNFLPRSWHEIVDIISSIQSFKTEVIEILNEAIENESDPLKLQRFRNTIVEVRAKVTELLRDVNFRRDGALVVRTQNLNLALEPEDVEDISERLNQIHSSHNYGGNIEVAPPTIDAPLGKIIVGNARDENGRSAMDPDLERFLRMQRKQPMVSIDTNWLQVGHVDEIINFSKINSGNSFAAILASPSKATDILEEVFLLNTVDLTPWDPMRILNQAPFKHGDISMARGAHSVTKLLRGKSWLQSYRRNDQRVMPPNMYKRMNYHYNIGGSAKPFYPVPWRDDHFYDARISVREINYFGRYSNFKASEKMEQVKNTLTGAFNNLTIIELPVVFDTYNPDFEKTIAFTPDLVNYQTINNNVLIPRPYGPRMSMEDTIAVLERVMGRNYSSYLTNRYFRRKRLNKTFHWAINRINKMSFSSSGPSNSPVTVDLDWVANQFKDGFYPDTTDIDIIKRRIRRSNPGKFTSNGNLRNGWHKIEIPENKVDVFEAYTQIMLESIGMNVKWVDSWYYHIRSGGIHCGTNVIRTPDLSPSKAWWNVHPRIENGPGDYNIPDEDLRFA